LYQIVLDTNAYISGILFKGRSREILNLAREGIIEILISEKIIDGIERVLGLKFKRIQEDRNFECSRIFK
jgi:predicted nucleic acid-binding protein